MYEENSIQYKIEKVYTSLFNIKKFKKIVLECQKKEIILFLKHYTEGGCISASIGWNEKNHTIIQIDRRGVSFNGDESEIYSFDKIADLLIAQYGKYNQLSLF